MPAVRAYFLDVHPREFLTYACRQILESGVHFEDILHQLHALRALSGVYKCLPEIPVGMQAMTSIHQAITEG